MKRKEARGNYHAIRREKEAFPLMKGKFWRVLLSLCLTALCFATAARPAVGAESADSSADIYAFNLTGAGSDDIMNLYTGATYQERDEMLSMFRFPDMMDIVKFRYMGAAYNLHEDVTPLYLRDYGAPTTHELILYGSERLNPEMFTITTGVSHWEAFTGGHFGSGEGEIFYYRTAIEIPAQANYIVVMYRQQVVATWDAVRVSGFSGIASVYPTQLYPIAHEETVDGKITSFTLEVAGMNLPSSADAYSMENCTLTSFSGPDNVGKYTLTFRNDLPDEPQNLIWKPLLILGQDRTYFQESCLDIEEEAGRKSCVLNDEAYGVTAEMPHPYYNIRLGGTLEENSAPVVAGDSDGTALYSDILVYPPSARFLFALYDGNGKMISCQAKSDGELLAFTADSPGAAYAKLILTDENLAPLNSPKTIPLA